MILRSAAVMRPDSSPTRRQHAGLFCGCLVRNISSSSSVAGEHRISEADAMSFNFSAVGVTSCRKGCMTAASTGRVHESAARHDEQKPSNLTESESRGCRLSVAAWLVSIETQKNRLPTSVAKLFIHRAQASLDRCSVRTRAKLRVDPERR
jgi:hypothetical protein